MIGKNAISRTFPLGLFDCSITDFLRIKMFEGSRRAWTHHWGKGIPRLLSEETGTLSRGLRIIHEGFKCVLIVGPWLVVLEWPFSCTASFSVFSRRQAKLPVI